jgi:hypothetical protein
MSTRLALAAALAGLSLSFASGARALDLTGSWEGSWSCQRYDGTTSKTNNKDSTLTIFQANAMVTFNALLDGEIVYNGTLIPDTGDGLKLGAAVLAQCGTDPFPISGLAGELIRFKAKGVDPEKGTGTLTGVSVFEAGDPVGVTSLCKYKFKRVSTKPPSAPTCL